MHKDARIYIAGHRGMVGSAIMRQLEAAGHTHIITRTHAELDLTQQDAVAHFFNIEQPEYVFLAAAKVGGIHANNTYRGEFIYQNLMIQSNVIHHAWLHGVKKLVFLGSSCIYPRESAQPIKEEYLLTGPLEPTNQPYAVAKIAGIEMCQAYQAQYDVNFISVMPTNLYGPNDNYHLQNSHVLPALIRKFYEAKQNNSPSVMIWGDGSPRREFLHVDDMAAACIHLMVSYEGQWPLNIGTGEDVTIRELAETIKRIVGFEGALEFDTSKPNGTPRKLLDVSRLHAQGFRHQYGLEDGIRATLEEFIKNYEIYTAKG